MRHDDEMVTVCGTWAAGLFVIGLIVALVVSVAVVGYLTDGDISQ